MRMAPQIAAFMSDVGERSDETGLLADAVARHLGAIVADGLPPAARPHWHEVARLLRSDAGRPLPPRAVAAIRSWPTARAAELISHVRQLHTVLDRLANEAWEDEIRDKVRHSYL
jgi:hypothetical protein